MARRCVSSFGRWAWPRLSPKEQALRDLILTLSTAEAREAAHEIAQTHALSPKAVERVIVPYAARQGEVNPAEARAHKLEEREGLAITLVALGNQERVLVLEMLRDRIASPAVVQVLLTNADAITEAARSEERRGYLRASEAALTFSVGFRVAYFLYRSAKIVRPLADRLAERVEVLLIMRFVIERLRLFNGQKIRPIFGEPIADASDKILEERQAAVTGSLDALRRQYPDYATEIEALFRRQSTLRHEMARYESLFAEGLITKEIYDDLRRDVLGARAGQRHPRFDIGLDSHQLVERLDILSDLDDDQLDRVCRLLRPRFAVPNERILRKGERGDAVFFIASGAVEVVLPHSRVRLGSGEFFGEMALLSGRPRQADVVALTYCQFLVLRRSDFERFMKVNPDAKAKINRVAEARLALNSLERPTSSEFRFDPRAASGQNAWTRSNGNREIRCPCSAVSAMDGRRSSRF